MKLIIDLTYAARPLVLAGAFTFLALPACADIFGSGTNTFSIEFVEIGNPGNGDDQGDGGGSYSSPYGGVDYFYRMGVTEAPQDWITKATRLGMTNVTAGAWTGSRPAGNMTWYEAAAFVNWLNTSKGHPPAYNLTYSGGWSMALWTSAQAWQFGGENQYRNRDAIYFLPSQDEWYKAANHKNDGVTANYWDYATGSNRIPTAVASGTATGSVVYNGQAGPAAVDNDGGLSPYGTRGQNGNMAEWLESASDGLNNSPAEFRPVIGGFWDWPEDVLRSSYHSDHDPVSSFNFFGFRVASAAAAAAFDHLTIATPPRGIQAVADSTSGFFVVAGGPVPITYQWRFDGGDLAGKTNQFLRLTDVKPEMEGDYTVVVSDATDSLVSQPASLTVVFKPEFISIPLSQSVVVGGSVTFSAEITGTTPFTCQWRKGTSFGASKVLAEVQSTGQTFLTLTNVQPSDTGTYRLYLVNVASPDFTSSSSNRVWSLTVLADSDGDGMPDAWEIDNELDPANASDALLDSDRDGLSNLAEYRSGTVATNAESGLRVASLTSSNGQATLTFPAARQTYTVEATSRAVGGIWERVADVIARPTEHLQTVVDPRGGQNTRFYRVVTPKRP